MIIEKEKTDIKKLGLNEIECFLAEHNEKKFRAKQIYEWLWVKNCTDFDEMSNLSKKMRQLLADTFIFQSLQIYSKQTSSDGTVKVAFETFDNEIIEGVLIPSRDRATACISSQIGCSLNCNFCATGKLGFKRNLTRAEIVEQFFALNQLSEENFDTGLTNIVVMGMGEPLLNYDETLNALNILSDPKGLNISPRRITLSTVGIVKMIYQLADDNVRFNLAVSLHSADQSVRTKLIPSAHTNSLNDLAKAIRYFNQKTNTRVTIEYLLLNKVNDSLTDAQKLALFCRNFPCKVNLIEYNATGEDFQKSPQQNVNEFMQFLESKNMIVNLRYSKGEDIDAACGQLAKKSNISNTEPVS